MLVFSTVTPPAQRVQFILGEDIDKDGETLESHPLFSEMEELFKDGDDLEWKETARWVKFEEDVEEGKFLFVLFCFVDNEAFGRWCFHSCNLRKKISANSQRRLSFYL